MGQYCALLDDGDRHVSRHRGPDLHLHGVLAGAEESRGVQVPRDPLEDQLDLPARPIQPAHATRWQLHVVGRQDEALAVVVAKYHPAQRRRVPLLGVENLRRHGLVAHHAHVDPGALAGIAPLDAQRALGADEEEGAGLALRAQPCGVHVAAIQQLERTGLGQQFVQRVDVVRLAFPHVDEARNRAVHVQQRMQLHRRLGGASRRLRVHRQAQVDGRGVERVDRLFEAQLDRLVGVQRPGDADQMLRQVGVDLARPYRVWIGQRVVRHRRAKAHAAQPLVLGSQAGLDVAQRVADSQVLERQRVECVQTREVLDLVLAVVACRAASKRRLRQASHDLREHAAQIAETHRSIGFVRPPSDLLVHELTICSQVLASLN